MDISVSVNGNHTDGKNEYSEVHEYDDSKI